MHASSLAVDDIQARKAQDALDAAHLSDESEFEIPVEDWRLPCNRGATPAHGAHVTYRSLNNQQQRFTR